MGGRQAHHRQDRLLAARRCRGGHAEPTLARSLADDIAAPRPAGNEIMVVSSGAIALGRNVLKLPEGALKLEDSQASAAVGQIDLAHA